MKKINRASWIVSVLGVCAIVGVSALAQPGKSTSSAQPTSGDKGKGQHEHCEMAGPGAEHEKLMKLAGEYSTKLKVSAPGMDAGETTGTATVTSTLGGRFLKHEESGEMFGEKFAASKVWGYNADAKRYEGMWTYSGSTALMNLVGKSSDGGKTIDYDATHQQAGSAAAYKVWLKIVSDNEFTVTLKGNNPDGTEGGTLVTTYTRRK